jgi:hypothetical protein
MNVSQACDQEQLVHRGCRVVALTDLPYLHVMHGMKETSLPKQVCLAEFSYLALLVNLQKI